MSQLNSAQPQNIAIDKKFNYELGIPMPAPDPLLSDELVAQDE